MIGLHAGRVASPCDHWPIVGAVAKMRSRWERDDARRRFVWRELLWVPPVVAAFMAGALVIPRTKSGWLDAAPWIGYGALLMALLFLAFRIARRAPAGFPVRLVFILTVLTSMQRSFPEGWDDGVRVLVLGAVVGAAQLLSEYAASRRKRRAAAPGTP